MSGDDDQLPSIMTSEVQGQLDGLSKEIKEMAASIATLVKAITPQGQCRCTKWLRWHYGPTNGR